MTRSIISPVTYGVSVPAASTLVLQPNLQRQGVYVFNPSAVAIWVCPAAGPQSALNPGGANFPAVVAGGGSLVIQPQQGIALGPPSMPPFTAGLNAISASGTNPLSIWEFYP
jgi:hypothetical protein